MSNETFRSRVAKLIQKSRKALRLYSTMNRVQNGADPECAELQLEEWRTVNQELLKQLTSSMENSTSRGLSVAVCSVRNRFFNEWKLVETELNATREELIAAAEGEDFVKSVSIGKKLVELKARFQATHAAYHELEDVLTKSKVSGPAIELDTSDVIDELEEEQETGTHARVIPFKKKVHR